MQKWMYLVNGASLGIRMQGVSKGIIEPELKLALLKFWLMNSVAAS
jgi:hypothetical protein